MNFRQLNDAELAQLSTEELVAYVNRARRAGRDTEAIEAARILAFSQERAVTGFVASKMHGRGETVWSEVAEQALFDAIRSVENFDGRTEGEFRSWVFTIAKRRIMDHLRKGYVGKKGGEEGTKVTEVPLEVSRGDGDEGERPELGGDPSEAAELKSVFMQALDGLSDRDKLVICLVRFHDLPHRQVADQVNRHFGDESNDSMTEQNVAKINSRFGQELQRILDEADDPLADTDDTD